MACGLVACIGLGWVAPAEKEKAGTEGPASVTRRAGTLLVMGGIAPTCVVLKTLLMIARKVGTTSGMPGACEAVQHAGCWLQQGSKLAWGVLALQVTWKAWHWRAKVAGPRP